MDCAGLDLGWWGLGEQLVRGYPGALESKAPSPHCEQDTQCVPQASSWLGEG